MKIAAVLAGVLQLVLAAVVIGIPGVSTTLDAIATPDDAAASPPSAPAIHRMASSVPARRVLPTADPTSAVKGPATIRPTTSPTPGPSPTRSRHSFRISSPERTPATAVRTKPLVSAPVTRSRHTDPPTGVGVPDADQEHAPPGRTKEPPGHAAAETYGPKGETPEGTNRQPAEHHRDPSDDVRGRRSQR
ncbi:hypothetical protein ABZ297_41740 [Nonomuraea sp. NPDC005983]|uniref:hypothetical protein n=1 Tax=Nonomuraea sp. NPDC005983 TaxID=3155595 RepID=UPI0033A626C6